MLKHFSFFLLFIFLSACSSSQDIDEIFFDEADLVKKDSKLMQQYVEQNHYLLSNFDIDFRVITTSSKEDINLFANRRFQEIESRSSSGRTLLLVVNSFQDKTRLEVSTSLEHIFTDAFVSYIERKGMVPYFRDDKIADGIFMMSELVQDTANDKASQGADDMPIMKSHSVGAGAKTEAKIGQKKSLNKNDIDIKALSTDMPEDILNKYFDSLRAHNKNPNLDIFTKETRNFFTHHTVTDINQNNEIRFAASCNKGRVYYNKYGYAVRTQPLEPRTCAPYFFKFEEGKWRLDIFTMAKTIRFNQSMQWHFDMKEKDKYLMNYTMFFQNFNFDNNGFPYYKQRKKLKWGFTCSPYFAPDMPKLNRCQITWLADKGKAKNLLKLRLNDIILATKNQSNPSLEAVMIYMKERQVGEKVQLLVLRNNTETKLSTILE